MESLPIPSSDLVRVHPGRQAALPTATGCDEALRSWPGPQVHDYSGRGTGVAGVAIDRPIVQLLGRDAVVVCFPACSCWSVQALLYQRASLEALALV